MFQPFFYLAIIRAFIVITNPYTLYMSVMSFRLYYKDVYKLKCVLKLIKRRQQKIFALLQIKFVPYLFCKYNLGICYIIIICTDMTKIYIGNCLHLCLIWLIITLEGENTVDQVA
jgi:hypothetical protein